MKALFYLVLADFVWGAELGNSMTTGNVLAYAAIALLILFVEVIVLTLLYFKKSKKDQLTSSQLCLE